jgi:hypothetical protein
MLAPAFASLSAIARPILRPDPVISAVRPSSDLPENSTSSRTSVKFIFLSPDLIGDLPVFLEHGHVQIMTPTPLVTMRQVS